MTSKEHKFRGNCYQQPQNSIKKYFLIVLSKTSWGLVEIPFFLKHQIRIKKDTKAIETSFSNPNIASGNRISDNCFSKHILGYYGNTACSKTSKILSEESTF